MARPLTPISREHINEYKLKIENAIKENDKQTLKETKRLFIVYIKKRGKKITDFRRYAIYKYFKDRERPTEKEHWGKIVKPLKRRLKEIVEYKPSSYDVYIYIERQSEQKTKNICNVNTGKDYLSQSDYKKSTEIY